MTDLRNFFQWHKFGFLLVEGRVTAFCGLDADFRTELIAKHPDTDHVKYTATLPPTNYDGYVRGDTGRSGPWPVLSMKVARPGPDFKNLCMARPGPARR